MTNNYLALRTPSPLSLAAAQPPSTLSLLTHFLVRPCFPVRVCAWSGTAVPVADATVELLRPSIAPPVSAVLGGGRGGAGAGGGAGHALSAVEGGILSVCKAGRYLAIVWPHLKCYAIYDSAALPGCDLVDSGVGVDIAWCWTPYTRSNGREAHTQPCALKVVGGMLVCVCPTNERVSLSVFKHAEG
jgi:hypothetical protein